MMALSHPWRSTGQKRTMTWSYEPSPEILRYLRDMQDSLRYSLQVAFRDAEKDGGRIPSPIQLRREIRIWFYSRFSYARHHINPVCRTTVALLRAYKKCHHGKLGVPRVRKLAMRIDGDLFRVLGQRIRVTLQPNRYEWVQINTGNKHFDEYSKGRQSELLLTEDKVCLTFTTGDGRKQIKERLVAADLNFRSIDTTSATSSPGVVLTGVTTTPLDRIVQIQNDFSRRRGLLQKHIQNPQKRSTKLKETRGRQRNRIRDAVHKLSTKIVKENLDATFVFENLKGVRRNDSARSRVMGRYLHRWPYRMYQSFVDYKSPNKTLYVNPRGTSSECPVCGEKLEHPAWAISRCNKCGVDYNRDRLASLAILCRGLRLCGHTPSAVSADASWQSMRNEYLYTRGGPKAARTGGTEVASAPNGGIGQKNAPPLETDKFLKRCIADGSQE